MATRARTRTRLTCSFSPASYPSLISSASPLVGRVLHPETPRPPTPRPFLDTARDTGPPPLEERPHSTLVTLVLACVFLTHWLPWDTPFVSLYLLSAYGTGCPQRRLGAFGSRLYPSYEAARAATRRPGNTDPRPAAPALPSTDPRPALPGGRRLVTRLPALQADSGPGASGLPGPVSRRSQPQRLAVAWGLLPQPGPKLQSCQSSGSGGRGATPASQQALGGATPRDSHSGRPHRPPPLLPKARPRPPSRPAALSSVPGGTYSC